MKKILFLYLCAVMTLVNGCGVIDLGRKTVGLAGDTIVFAGKVVTTTVKTTGAVLKTTGDVAGAGVRLLSGSKTIALERVGSSYFVEAVINGKHKARLMIDTGSSSVLISPKLAREMGLKLSSGGYHGSTATLADGSSVASFSTILEELKIGRASVDNVMANVIQTNSTQHFDGLLGMSFLRNFNFTIDTEKHLLILKDKAPG